MSLPDNVKDAAYALRNMFSEAIMSDKVNDENPMAVLINGREVDVVTLEGNFDMYDIGGKNGPDLDVAECHKCEYMGMKGIIIYPMDCDSDVSKEWPLAQTMLDLDHEVPNDSILIFDTRTLSKHHYEGDVSEVAADIMKTLRESVDKILAKEEGVHSIILSIGDRGIEVGFLEQPFENYLPGGANAYPGALTVNEEMSFLGRRAILQVDGEPTNIGTSEQAHAMTEALIGRDIDQFGAGAVIILDPKGTVQ